MPQIGGNKERIGGCATGCHRNGGYFSGISALEGQPMEKATETGRHDLRSSAWFRDQRDFWWNDDFIALLAERWRLDEAHSLADIGCGLGHWARLLFPFLGPDARLTGVDREVTWLARAREVFLDAYPAAVAAGRVEFDQGDVNSLALPADTFDVVTCQTLLMHLDKPERGLAEMFRIAKSGGLVVCVEPSNLFNMMSFDSCTSEQSTEDLVRNFEFWLRFQRGRIALGKGDISIGERLPGMFAEIGSTDINVYLRDKAFPVYPPYSGPEQEATLEPIKAWESSDTGPWNYAQLARYFLAGEGTAPMLESQLAAMRAEGERQFNAVSEKRYSCGGGAVVYIVSGRKP
ncbi:methyltransferase domain-containing protein [Nocardia goodfellowii]|uniref:Ubiquinone/menaquinone biosynthesis C-methylase UbiE n=1 Tax=Nocardia goodfellowii TaxID=882446 RepID=A0ABS4QHG4_9NOCA|nr:methyltransferase domain-containing protein [Nocardia goodfellowii]MBP2191127.1 ubiquinone/menaquinone biosynthesis C-methylase UbiE [Nocardia goodfellowii]